MKKEQQQLLRFLYKQYDNMKESKKFLKTFIKNTIEDILQSDNIENSELLNKIYNEYIFSSRESNDIEEKIFKMYANGRSIDEIEEYLNIIYGSNKSRIIIDEMIYKIIELQSRSLNSMYPKVFFDYDSQNSR